MPATDHTIVARVYADALLDLATAQGDAGTIDQEFGEFGALIRIDPDFGAFIQSRIVDRDQRTASLDAMFKDQMHDLLLDTLQVLNRKDRLDIVDVVQQEYHQAYLRQQGIREVDVVTAEPLTESLRQRLTEVMANKTQQKVQLIEHVDPEVLGGLIVRVGDHQMDNSVRCQLHRFGDTLEGHADDHIHAGTELFEGGTEI